MARVVQKPLIMRDDIPVRTYPDLVENFDLKKALFYLKNGELERWLRSRQQEEKANDISELDVSNEKVEKRLCKILLPSDRVAFVQDELNDILDSNEQKIYLYGTEFTIPVNKGNVTYIGLNRPVINVDSGKIEDLGKVNSQLKNCEFRKMKWSYNSVEEYEEKYEKEEGSTAKHEFMHWFRNFCLKSVKESGGINYDFGEGNRGFIPATTPETRQRVADMIVQWDDGSYHFDFEEKP